jgi:hypothetical protein
MSSIHAGENTYDARVDVGVDAWMVQGMVHIVRADFTCQEAKNEVERNIFQGRQLAETRSNRRTGSRIPAARHD